MNAKLSDIQPAYSDKNPKLDFYGHDGKYLYSSNWYESARHAWAHVAKNPVSGYSKIACQPRRQTERRTQRLVSALRLLECDTQLGIFPHELK